MANPESDGPWSDPLDVMDAMDAIDDAACQSPLDCLRAWAQRRPDGLALVRADSHESVTFAELLAGVARAATWLQGQGVRENDTVATLFADAPEGARRETCRQIELAYAIGWLGATLLPLYPGTAPKQLGPVLERWGVRWLLVSDDGPGLTKPTPDTFAPERLRLRVLRASGYVASAPSTGPKPGAPMQRQDPSRGFLYEFSSGTSGTPKVVLQSNANYVLTARVSCRAQGWQTGDVHLGAMRWPHKLGLRALFRAHCMGAAWLDEAFPLSFSRLHQLVREAGLSSMTSTPVQLRMVLASEEPSQPGPVLRLLSNSGAALSVDEMAQVRARITPNFYAVYGGTETGIVALLHPHDPPDAPMRLVPGVELATADLPEEGLPGTWAGRLRIRSPWMCQQYEHNDSATQASFQGGWYLSNDEGQVTGSQLRLGPRLDDMINFGGGKVDPLPVESVLRLHPEVADAAVVAMADVWEGQVPVAFVVARQSIDLAALRQHVDMHLDAGQRPAFFVVARSLPYNPDGKVKRSDLRRVADQLRAKVKMPSDLAT